MGFSEHDINKMITIISQRLLGTRGTFQTKIRNFLQVTTGDYGHRSYHQSGALFPLLAMSLKEHLEAETEITEITNGCGDHILQEAQSLEVGYGKRATVVTEGHHFLRFHGTPLVVYINQDTWSLQGSSFVLILYRPEDKEAAEKFLEGLEERLTHRNFYKGQKLLFVKEQDGYRAQRSLKFLNTEGWAERKAILPEALNQCILENTLGWLRNAEILRRTGLATRRGLLLFGPPGTGKTLLFKNLCAQAEGITCLFASAESFEEPQEVSEFYTLARFLRPTLVFIEDLDFMGGDRILHGHGNKLLGTLLAELDGVKGNDEVVTLASTNYPEVIDKALSDRPGRFDLKVEIQYPALGERWKILSNFLAKTNGGIRARVNEEELMELAEATSGLSGAHLSEIVTLAASRCLFDNKETLIAQDLDRAFETMKQAGKAKSIGFTKKER